MLYFKKAGGLNKGQICFDDRSRAQFDRLREAFRIENKASRFARQYSYSIQPFKYPIAPLGSYQIGMTSSFVDWCSRNGIQCRIDPELLRIINPDLHIDGIEPVQNPEYKYRDYQLKLIEALARTGRGIILSPTRSGKSLVLAGLFHNILLNRDKNGIKNILLVVPNLLLVEQFMDDLEEYYSVKETTVDIEFEDGRKISLDGNTEVNTADGVKKAKDLAKNDDVLSINF